MTMRKAYARLLMVLWTSDLLAVRLMLGCSELIWAGFLFAPGDTFESPAYAVMAGAMDETAWATLFLVTGVFQLGILIAGCYHNKASVVFAAYNAGLWLFIPISVYLSGYTTASISGECGMALAAAWVYLRSGYLTAGEIYGRGEPKRT